MSDYLGDFAEDATVHIMLTTVTGAGGLTDPGGSPANPFEAADVRIYKNNSAAQKTTTNGITMTSPFDSVTGLHQIVIDTSNNTGDAGFWTRGDDYQVVLLPDETVDGETVGKVWQFSIENRSMSASIAEPSAPPTWPCWPRDLMAWLQAKTRNRRESTSTQERVRNDAQSANIATAAVSDTAGTTVRDEYT